MKILVTGGTGLIGRGLIEKLQAHQLTVLSRNPGKARNELPDGIEITTDLSEVDFNELEVVINLAGEPIADKRWSKNQKEKICQSRWQLTQSISDAIKLAETPPHTFISGSAIGFYGRQGSQVIDESYKRIHDEFSHQLCRQWEVIAREAESERTRVCLIRTGIVLAKQDGALAKMLPAFKLGLGGPIAEGQQMMSWIHIDDMVAVLLEAMTNVELFGALNATAPEAVSNEHFSKALSHVLHRPCLFRIPGFMMSLLLGEFSELLLYGQNVVPGKLRAANFTFKFPKLDDALRDLLKP